MTRRSKRFPVGTRQYRRSWKALGILHAIDNFDAMKGANCTGFQPGFMLDMASES